MFMKNFIGIETQETSALGGMHWEGSQCCSINHPFEQVLYF